MTSKRWTVHDRHGHLIYLTQERWDHIIGRHPEMEAHEKELRDCLQTGQRKQDPLNPQKYKYSRLFPRLAGYNNLIVAVVLFKFGEDENGLIMANNYLVTAYQKATRH